MMASQIMPAHMKREAGIPSPEFQKPKLQNTVVGYKNPIYMKVMMHRL